jgi:hypothetical protein
MENTTVVEKPKSKTNKYLLAIAVVVVLILGLVAAIFLAKETKNIKERASTPTGIAKVRLSPTTKTIEVGDEFESVIYFDTGGRAISAITVQLSYTYTGNEPPISTDDLIEIDSSLVLDSSWNFPIKTVTSQNGTTIIKIGGYNNSDSGFTSTGEQSLATLTFKGESSGSINVTFDSSVSKNAQNKGRRIFFLLQPVPGSTQSVAQLLPQPQLQPLLLRQHPQVQPQQHLLQLLPPTALGLPAQPLPRSPFPNQEFLSRQLLE